MKELYINEKYGPDVKKIEELFNVILRESDYNLNQFVKGDILGISREMSAPFFESLEELVEILPDIVKNIDDIESFWTIFQKLDDYTNNDKFIIWLQEGSKPVSETFFIKDLDFETFIKMSDYCFYNLILQDVGKKRIEETIGDEKQIQILKKAIFTFCDMIISDNFSKENAFESAGRMFEIEESYCEIWWKYVKENQDKLWKIMMMKRCKNLEIKLELLLKLMDV